MPRSRKRLIEIRVTDLPWPDNPFRCGLARDLRALHPLFDEVDREEQQRLFAAFVQTQTRAKIRECRYHQVDVERANGLAPEALRSGQSIDGLIVGEEDEVARLARSYHVDPITWDRASPTLTNGIHRVCGLKLSAAGSCVIQATG